MLYLIAVIGVICIVLGVSLITKSFDKCDILYGVVGMFLLLVIVPLLTRLK